MKPPTFHSPKTLLIGFALVALAVAPYANGQAGPRLFAIQRDGADLREIAKGFGEIGKVEFSPDGTKLVIGAIFYNLIRPRCSGIAGNAPVNGKLFLMNSDGSNPHEIPGYSSAFDPSFTTDGQKILFTAIDESAGTCQGKLLGIYSINLDGTDAKLIVPDATSASSSADGSKLVYRKGGALYVSNKEGTTEKQLVNAAGYWLPTFDLDPTLSRPPVFNPTDSSEIMLTDPISPTIFTLNVDSSVRHVLLHGPIDLRAGVVLMLQGASYSPDGKTVVYSARISDTRPDGMNDHAGYVRHSEIYELSTDTSSVRRITDNVFKDNPVNPNDPSGQTYSPIYSPDGKSILFLARRPLPPQLFQPPQIGNQLLPPDQ
jgi:Tol biopolymer transport system component